MPALTVPQAFELALQHHQCGRLAEAEALYRQILGVQPNHAGAWHYLGVVALQKGRHDLGAQWIGRALELDPTQADAHSDYGEALRSLGRLDEAIAAYGRAIQLDPRHAQAHSNLGIALKDAARLGEAAAACRQAIALKPEYADAHKNLGIILAQQGSWEEATTAYRRVIEIQPGDPVAYNNLGGILVGLGRIDEAIACLERALAVQPNSAPAHNNLAAALGERGLFDRADAEYRRALALTPDFAGAQTGWSMLLLLRGDFTRGWPLYEARRKGVFHVERTFAEPMWDGGELHGRRLLIHAEQGYGDSIQFIRYAALAAARGARIIVECQRTLVALFREVAGVSKVVTSGDPLPPFDLHMPMLSLPMVFQTRRETIPANVPYLAADPHRREIWKARLGADRGRRRVGLAWAGNRSDLRLHKRHIPLVALIPLLRVEGIDFFSIQIGDGAEQLGHVAEAREIVDHTAHITDFADTAAMVEELDLIISVDTALAHLAGALGRPVWTFLPFIPDWRWGLEGEDTPWYPTMRLFRQSRLGEWDEVVERVATALRDWCGS